jgi:hypothetical protein
VERDQLGDIFGHPVGRAGDVNEDGYDDVLVASIQYDHEEVDEGAVFLYLGSESGLTAEHAWMVEGNQASSNFGFGAETAGDVDGDAVDDVIVGAYWYDNVEINEGAAFVYLGSTAVVPAGRIPSQTPLLLHKTIGNGVRLTWGPSCLEGDSDYEIYEGDLGDFTGYRPLVCSTGGERGVVIVPSNGATYYLVVPRNTSWEGSYGETSDGSERSRGTPSCLPQAIGECE